jgi:hypothetical protein
MVQANAQAHAHTTIATLTRKSRNLTSKITKAKSVLERTYCHQRAMLQRPELCLLSDPNKAPMLLNIHSLKLDKES